MPSDPDYARIVCMYVCTKEETININVANLIFLCHKMCY
jgi:hypothetical protein